MWNPFRRRPAPTPMPPAPSVTLVAAAPEIGPEVSVLAKIYRIGAIRRDFERRWREQDSPHPNRDLMLSEAQALGAALVHEGAWVQEHFDEQMKALRELV